MELCLTVASILLQVFFLQGRFIFGPDARSLFVTMFLIIAPVSIFCAFVARELMDRFSYSLGLPVIIAAVLFTAYVSTIFSLLISQSSLISLAGLDYLGLVWHNLDYLLLSFRLRLCQMNCYVTCDHLLSCSV